MRTRPHHRTRLIAVPAGTLLLCLALAGCTGQVSMFPNADPALRKTPAQFAADAAKRTYPDMDPLPGTDVARVQVGYQVDALDIANLSDQDWNDAEVWLNRRYVVTIPFVQAKSPRVKQLNFRMFYDSDGNSFPTNNNREQVEQVDLYVNGQLYSVPFRQSD